LCESVGKSTKLLLRLGAALAETYARADTGRSLSTTSCIKPTSKHKSLPAGKNFPQARCFFADEMCSLQAARVTTIQSAEFEA
jgi:hypothetical protein